MRALDVAVKGVKETFRDLKGLGFLLAFPIMFMLIFRVSFGWGGAVNETYDIAVLVLDDGTGPWDAEDPAWMPLVNSGMGINITGRPFFDQFALNGSADAGTQFTEDMLQGSMYEDGETLLFKVRTVTSEREGEGLVEDGEVVALVVIPANFTSAIMGVCDTAGVEEVRAHSIPIDDPLEGYAYTLVDVRGVQGNTDYAFASSIVGSLAGAYSDATGVKVRQIVGTALPGGPAPNRGTDIQAQFVSMGETEEFIAFDWIAPGLIVFGLMMIVMIVSATLSMEVKNRTLDRLRLTKMSAVDMMAGETMRFLVVGALQTIILFVVAVLVGTHFAGSYGETLPVAILMGLVIVLASIALGLVISSFVDDPDQASNLATLIVVPMSFLTGAFFDLDVIVTRYFPWTQGSIAMRQLLIYNDLDAAMYHTGLCLIGGMVLFAIGAFLFHYKRLRGV